jgi:hypothetical protein
VSAAPTNRAILFSPLFPSLLLCLRFNASSSTIHPDSAVFHRHGNLSHLAYLFFKLVPFAVVLLLFTALHSAESEYHQNIERIEKALQNR